MYVLCGPLYLSVLSTHASNYDIAHYFYLMIIWSIVAVMKGQWHETFLHILSCYDKVCIFYFLKLAESNFYSYVLCLYASYILLAYSLSTHAALYIYKEDFRNRS
jgi:hypothetical protein